MRGPKAELGKMHRVVMGIDKEETTERWLGRRHGKEEMNGIGTGDHGNRQPQEADIVVLPVLCKK